MLSATQLISFYPRAWRERYGAEFAALLEDAGEAEGFRPRAILDVLLGAIDAHIRQRTSDRAAAQAERALVIGGKVTMGTIFGVLLAVVVWVLAVTVEGGDIGAYVYPTPAILAVGGVLAALLISHGAAGIGALPGLFGLALRGPASVSGSAIATTVARYRLGRDLFRTAGHFALLSGVIATLLGVVLILSSEPVRPEQLGRPLAVAISGFLDGAVVAIFCYALSANLRHKGEQLDGTLRALSSAAAELEESSHAARPAHGVVAAPAI